MTLSGVTGSGKSTLINTLVTAIRKITQKTNSVYVVGPTGAADYNAGGVTGHHLFNIKGQQKEFDLKGGALRTLMSKLENTVALIVDERSMVSSLLLGTMEAYCRQAAFKATKRHLRWGGLPIVVLVGDDHQLPSIEEGAFHCFENNTRERGTKVEQHFVQNGKELFKEFGKDVMTLAASKRVLEGQVQL